MLYNAAKRPRICTHGVPSPVALIHNTLNCISQRLSRLIQPNQKYTTTSKVDTLRLRRRAQSISITIDWKTQVLLVVRQFSLFSQCPPKHLPLWRVVCQELRALGQRKLTTITTGHSGSFYCTYPSGPRVKTFNTQTQDFQYSKPCNCRAQPT